MRLSAEAPHRRRRPSALLLVGALSLASGCQQLGLAEPPEDLESVRSRHLQPLGRSHCAGCPDEWEDQACGFLDVLQREGTGSEAALCTKVTATRPVRKYPPGVAEMAEARLAEALEAAGEDPDAALRIFSMGSDLQRLARPELWTIGEEAHERALDLLAGAPPDGASWPGALVRLVDGALPPVRVTDMLVADAIGSVREVSDDRADLLRKASELSRDAIRAQRTHRLGAVLSFSEVASWPVDPLDAWARGEQVQFRALQLALTAALVPPKGGECVESLDALVPERLPYVPDGWSLDTASCSPKAGYQAPNRPDPGGAAATPEPPADGGLPADDAPAEAAEPAVEAVGPAAEPAAEPGAP